MCSVHFEHMWPSKCMDLRPGLVIFLLLFCFFAFFGWQSCSTDRVRLDRSIERHMNYGGRAEEHSQIKYSQHAPHHMQISLPLFSYTSSPFFFFFQRTHWPAERHKSYCGHTVSIYTERPACKDEAESLAHKMDGWSVVTQDGWQAPSPGKQTHGYVGINRNDKQTSMDILMVIFKAHTDRWRHYCKQSPITICDNLQSKPYLG